MQKSLKQFFILLCLVVVLILPYFVFASAPLDKLEGIREQSGYAEATATSMSEIIGQVVKAFLGLLGMIFIVLMLYGGYDWMTARGEESKIETAKSTITRAIIGVIIVVGSYAIWEFILFRVIIGFTSSSY